MLQARCGSQLSHSATLSKKGMGPKSTIASVSRDQHLTWIRMLCRGYCSMDQSSSAYFRADVLKTIHVVNLCNSLAEWSHAMIVSHYINIILILISCLILSLNLVTQMWKIILKYPGTFQYTFCHAHYKTPKNWRNFIISNCPGGCQGNDWFQTSVFHYHAYFRGPFTKTI